MNRHSKLFLQFFFFLILMSFKLGVARAAAPDIACIASTTAAYMETVVGGADGLRNIRLLSPAFNMTSTYFDQMIGIISASPAWGSLYGMAGNAYNTHGGTVYSFANHGLSLAGGKPLMITESGWFDLKECQLAPTTGINYPDCPISGSTAEQRLTTAVNQLSTLGGQILGINFFNAFAPPGDPGCTVTDAGCYSYGIMSNGQIQSICSGLGLSKCGVNFASGIGQEPQIYGRAGGIPLGFVTGSMTTDAFNPASSAQAAADVANILWDQYHIVLVMRVGPGVMDAGGFEDPNTYVEFLNALDPMLHHYIYAIAGPNEPETDCWASTECQGCGGTLTGAAQFCYIGQPRVIKGKVTWDESCSDPTNPELQSYGLAANGVVVVPLSGYKDNTPPLNFSDGLTGKRNGEMANGHLCSYNCAVSGRRTTDTTGILACESIGWSDHSELVDTNKCDPSDPTGPTKGYCSGQYSLTVQRNFQNFENAVYLGFFCNGETTPRLTKKVFLDAPIKTADVKVQCGCHSTPAEPPDSWAFQPNSVGECSGLSVAQNAVEERNFEGKKNIAMQCDKCDDTPIGQSWDSGNVQTAEVVPATKPLPAKFAEKLALNPMTAWMSTGAATGWRKDYMLPPSEGYSNSGSSLQNCNEFKASNSIVSTDEYPNRNIQLSYEQPVNLQLPMTVDSRIYRLLNQEDWLTEVCVAPDTHAKVKLCDIQLPDNTYIADSIPALASQCNHVLTNDYFGYWFQYGFLAKNSCAMAFGNKDDPDHTIASKTPRDALANINNETQVKVAAWNAVSTGTRAAKEGIYSAQSSGDSLGSFCAKLAETVLYDSEYNKSMGFRDADIYVLKFPTLTPTELFQNLKKTRGRTLNIDTQQEMCTVDVYNANTPSLAQSKNAFRGTAAQVSGAIGQVDEWSPIALLSRQQLTLLNPAPPGFVTAPAAMWGKQYTDQVDVLGMIVQAISQFIQWVTGGYGTDTTPASPQGSCFLIWDRQPGESCNGDTDNSCAVREDIGNCAHQTCRCPSAPHAVPGCESSGGGNALCWELCGNAGGATCGSDLCTETTYGTNENGVGLTGMECNGNIIAPLETTVQGLRPYSSKITEGSVVKNSVFMFPTNKFQITQGDFTHSAKASDVQGRGWNDTSPPVHELSTCQGCGADYNFPFFVQKDTINMQSDTVAFPTDNSNSYVL